MVINPHNLDCVGDSQTIPPVHVELNAVKKAHDSVIVVDTYLIAGSIQGRGNSSAEVGSGRRSYSTGSLSQPLLGRNVVDINFTQGCLTRYISCEKSNLSGLSSLTASSV